MKKIILLIIIAFMFHWSCREQQKPNKKDVSIITIAHGQMPAAAAGDADALDIVFGNGDSLMYIYSANKGASFSSLNSLIFYLTSLLLQHVARR